MSGVMHKSGFLRRKVVSNVGLMFVASIVLSVASYYTTYLGMKQYVAETDWLLAAAITFGLQSIMFATAWIASDALGSSLRSFLVFLVIYTLCALVSIFFSFSSLFNSIFDKTQRDMVNASYMSKFYQDTVLELDTQLKDRIVTAHRDLLAGAEFAEWRRQVDRVITLQRTAPDILTRRVVASRQAAERDLSETMAELASLESQEAALKAERDRLFPEAKALDARLGSAREALAADRDALAVLQSRIAVLEAQMEAELQGIGSTAGRGPAYRRLEQERDSLLRESIPIETRLKSATAQPEIDERQRLDDRLKQLDADLAKTGAMTETTRRRLVGLQARVDDVAAVAVLDGTQSIEKIQNAVRRAAASPDGFVDALDEAARVCATIVEELRAEPQFSAEAADFTCDYGALQPGLNSLKAMSDQHARFAGTCQTSVVPETTSGEAFATLTRAAEACFAAAGVQGGARRTELSYLVASRGPTAHPFVVAQNALFVDRLPVSYMAAVIAVVIDLLILMVALMAQMVQSNRTEKALRSLQDIRWEDRDDGRIAYVTLKPGTFNYAERRKIAVDLIARNLAYFDAGETRLYLSTEGRDLLREWLERETG